MLVASRKYGRRWRFEPYAAEADVEYPLCGRIRTDEERAIKVSRNSGDGDIYSTEETEFLLAVRRWSENTGHKFPSSVEHLRIAAKIGYRKVAESCDCSRCDGRGKIGLRACSECFGVGKKP